MKYPNGPKARVEEIVTKCRGNKFDQPNTT